MPRKRGDGEGTLKIRTINGRRVWWARWIAYDADGRQKRPEKILGAASQFSSKREAREALNKIIAETSGRLTPIPTEPTFREVWNRFVTMKTPKWSTAQRKTICSIFDRAVLPAIGEREVKALTPEPLQSTLNRMADMPVGKGGKRDGYSKSAIQKALRYLGACFEFAIDERIIEGRNPARKLELPRTRRGSERFYDLDEVRRLLEAAQGRERIILKLLIIGGLRPAEVFALRADDIGDGLLRIDEAVKDVERGEKRIGRTKTEEADAFIAIPADLEQELRAWASTRGPGLLFPTEKGTTWRIGNYLKRVLKPLAAGLNPPIDDMTHQAFRRTFATHFQSYGSVKDAQSQLRHARAETTLNHYQKQIPESTKAAVEAFASDLKPTVQ